MTSSGGIDGRRLANARRAAGYSQAALGSAVGASRQNVSDWEAGRANPGPTKLPTLARLLNTTVAELLGTHHPTLRVLRLAAGLSQTQVAQAVGVSTMTYSRWEKSGRQTPLHPGQLRALVTVLDADALMVTAALSTSRSDSDPP